VRKHHAGNLNPGKRSKQITFSSRIVTHITCLVVISLCQCAGILETVAAVQIGSALMAFFFSVLTSVLCALLATTVLSWGMNYKLWQMDLLGVPAFIITLLPSMAVFRAI